MKIYFLLSCLCALAVSGTIIDPEFAAFMVKYQKSYTIEELPHRINAFQQNKIRIQQLNEEARKYGLNTMHGINHFADMTLEEFKATKMGYRPSSEPVVYLSNDNIVNFDAVPESFDWRKKGAVTPVKDQGQCGSCWAFSATEGVESAWFLAGNGLVELAPQQVVSCDTYDGGCDGGDLPTAFKYIKEKGMMKESSYPYTSGSTGDNGQCKYKSEEVVARISGFKYATQKLNETEMQAVSLLKGPLSICVEADTWMSYTGGIIKNNCGTNLDHCVQIVGWGEENKIPYWVIRNSWNTNWGEDGYIRVERNKDLCGVAMEATYVTIN